MHLTNHLRLVISDDHREKAHMLVLSPEIMKGADEGPTQDHAGQHLSGLGPILMQDTKAHDSNSLLPSPPVLGKQSCALCFYDFDYFTHLMVIQTQSVCVSMSGILRLGYSSPGSFLVLHMVKFSSPLETE